MASQQEIEILRDGVRNLLLKKYAKTLADCGESPTEVANEEDKKVVQGFERALYNAAVESWKKGGRKIAFKAEYVMLFSAAEKALPYSAGAYPDRPLARQLKYKEVTPKDAAASGSLFAHESKDPRIVHRKMLVGSLLKDARLKTDRPRALELGTKIEASCYNHVIAASKRSENPYRRHWSSEAFTALYASRCATVNYHLDPEGSVRQQYGDAFVNNLIEGKVDPDTIGSMTETQMCPEASRKEREEIELRSRQQVVVKESNLFLCPHCKARRCTYYEKQSRSLDEPAEIRCTCLECKKPFRGG